jgi:hypothetical protein
MFTGFASENTPGVKVWDYTRTTSGTIRVALEDDCAPFQLFLTGGSSTTIVLQLPTGSPSGKQIIIKNEPFSTFTVQAIEIIDSASGGSSKYILGQGQKLTFVCVPNLTIRSGSSVGFVQWVPLEQGGLETLVNNSVVLSGELNRVQNSHAAVVSGFSNNASGQFSIVAGGSGNNAINSHTSVLGGSNSTANGSNSVVVGGTGNTAQSQYSTVCGGQNNNAGNTNAIVLGGINNSASGGSSVCVAGQQGTSRNVSGYTIFPASEIPIENKQGVQQAGLLILGRQTTDATATRLTSNAFTASTQNQVILPNNSAYTFQGTCIAARTAAGDTSSWKFEGAIKRGANAASTALVAAVTPLVIAQDAGAVTWVLAITADTTNGGIAVTVTGAAATTIRWVCKIETTEVTF